MVYCVCAIFLVYRSECGNHLMHKRKFKLNLINRIIQQNGLFEADFQSGKLATVQLGNVKERFVRFIGLSKW